MLLREGHTLAKPLERGHVEGAPADDWAADRGAVLIGLIGRLRLALRVVQGVVGVETIVLEEVPRLTAKGVAAALQRHVDDAAARPAVLRVVGVGLDAKFFDRVDRWSEVVASPCAVRRAIQQELVGALLTAIDRPGGAAA